MTTTSSATPPTVEDAVALGLTRGEYELVCEKQGRAPNQVELAMYSLLWSEHCAYKHSKRLLRTLPTEGRHVVMGPGENAGAVDVGGGLVCAFKVESHNHPSAVEPFQGAATGVGGILRDIFAIGARPIAVLDSLRFGEADSGRARYLLDGAVSGIGHYGNSIGVPTVGGEVYFEDPYEQNCLVNAMALGLAPARPARAQRGRGPGQRGGAVRGRHRPGRDRRGLGARLGRARGGGGGEAPDGAGGGSVRGEEAARVLSGAARAGSDRGAPGPRRRRADTSAASEMAAKGNVGIDLDVAMVPLREQEMEPFEVMVSESQERMLCVVEPGNVEGVLELCEKWEVGGAAIGRVTDSGHMRIFRDGELVGEMPVRALVDDCPLYDLAPERPMDPVYPPPAPAAGVTRETEAAQRCCSGCSPRRTSAPAGRCSSSTTRSSSRGPCAGPSRPTRRCWRCRTAAALAVSIDGNGRRVAADPFNGTIEAVLECAANLACVGGQPLGTTNNLNFGNPEKPHIAWQLSESVRGLGEACRALEAPIVGGNVSLYNEGAGGPIYPTPVIGMVGTLPDAGRAGRLGFLREGDEIALVGPFAPWLPASELAKLLGEPLPDGLPGIDIAAVGAAQAAVREGVRSGAPLERPRHRRGWTGGRAGGVLPGRRARGGGGSGTDFWEAISPAATGPGRCRRLSGRDRGPVRGGPGRLPRQRRGGGWRSSEALATGGLGCWAIGRVGGAVLRIVIRGSRGLLAG